ncbi:YjcZ family sporulation protein [Caldibacillus lycopersici]|uniref:YjcZ family sporulation protein n=1 Tax=Perspicuibacillus lycopersici TaxID=1325689 RepID=A0AAE3ISK1_9BACI|nr:YjcZ family sporulation protein [Perspicuibacillus lycopersici]MCU9613627.1 YjcZ family sporulation protein [Perspicuibacillus lycopersici]
MFPSGCSSCSYPVYGYGYPVARGGISFALIVVLFILLIIIGASCFGA